MNSDNLVYGNDPFKKTKSAVPRTLHGYFYQVKLCMWYINRFINKGIDFQMSSEWDEGGKFNDLVIRFKCNGREDMIFLQAKHSLEGTKNVDHFSKPKFFKYFESYLEIMKKEEFQKTAKRFIFSTNIDITKRMGEDFKPISSNDDGIFNETFQQLQFGDDNKFKAELFEYFQNCMAEKLSNEITVAETLAKNLNKTISTDDFKILLTFKKFLCTSVFKTSRKKNCLSFRKMFVKKQKLAKRVLKFRACLDKVLKDQGGIKKLNSSVIKTAEDFFTATDERVNTEDISKFFERFAFMVTPKEETLGLYVLTEIKETLGKSYQSIDDAHLRKETFQYFYYLLNWLKQTDSEQINKERGIFIVNDIKEKLLARMRLSQV